MKTDLKSKLIIMGVVLLLCFALTGCSSRAYSHYSDFEKEEDSDYSDKGFEASIYVSDANDMALGMVCHTVSGITEGFVEDIAEDIIDDVVDHTDYLNEFKGGWWNREEKTSTDHLTIKDVTLKSFQTDLDMGNINVSYSKNDTATVNVKYTASGKKKDVLEEILQTVDINYSIKKDTLQVSIVNKNTKKDIWNWLRNKYYNYYNLYVELDIILPESVNKFNIDNSLGDISLNSVKGIFDIHNSVGDVDLNEVTFVGKSEIEAELGKIECSLSKDIKESSEVTMYNSFEDIHIDTNSLPYTENKKDDSDEYWKVSASDTILINKLCEMSLNVDQGKITIK